VADNQAMETRIERVVLETPKYRIVGEMTLPSEGYRSRLSDILNKQDVAFIPIVNAEISPLSGGEPERRSFIAVGRGHVEVAYEYTE
jgi:hypothetical protein